MPRGNRNQRHPDVPSGDPQGPRGEGTEPAETPGVGSPVDASAKQPSLRQAEILDAYLEFPNAAAVGRAKHMSERQVRRVVHTFAQQLYQRRRERDAEHAARTQARMNRTQDWADENLSRLLERLEQFVWMAADGIALQAVKLSLDIALRDQARSGQIGPPLNPSIADASRDIIDRMETLATRGDGLEHEGANDEG